MLDLLRAASILYGDCSQEAGSSDIYISTGKVSVEQMADIIIKATDLEAEYNSKQYARDRATAYSQLNQFEMLFDDKQNNTTTWQDAIAAIKLAHPKP